MGKQVVVKGTGVQAVLAASSTVPGVSNVATAVMAQTAAVVAARHNVPSAGTLAAQPLAAKAGYTLTGAQGRGRSQKLAYNRTLPLVRVPGAAIGTMLQGYMANVAKVWVAGNTGNQLQTALNANGLNGGRHVRRLMRAGALVIA